MTDADRVFVERAVRQMLRFSLDLERIAGAALALADLVGIEDPVPLIRDVMSEQLRGQANVSS